MTQGGTATFKYDPFGRRIQKVFTQNSTTTTTNYLYDGDNAIETVDQNGSVVAKYAQGQNIDEPLAESVGGAAYDYEQDGLGSVTSLTNSSGTLSLSYTYDSFGKITASSGSVANPFRYTGRDFDSETGLYYYRARYYDPTTGRFLNEDPIQFRAGVNFYVFVFNRPTRLRDPKGKEVVGAVIGGVLGGIYGGIGAAVDPNATWQDILAGMGAGALTGGILGAADPSFGLLTTVAITAGGDLAAQVITGHGFDKCKPINWGSTLGAAAGGTLGTFGGPILDELTGWGAAIGKTALTGGPGALTPGIGAHLLPPRTPRDCGCK